MRRQFRSKEEMAIHGGIAEFDSASEDWLAYMERLDQYFIANGVDDAGKQRAILLSGCGALTYKLIKCLIAPEKPAEKTFKQLLEIVLKHFDPVPAITVQRYKFNVRMRQPGENVATFLSELRLLATKCDFGNSLEDMLHDRIVIGVNDSNIQRRLLAEPNLTLKRALEVAQAMETAERGSLDLQPAPAAAGVPVNAVEKQRRGVNDDLVKCFRCGGKHMAMACKFTDAECFNCGKKGHTYREYAAPKGSQARVRASVGDLRSHKRLIQ